MPAGKTGREIIMNIRMAAVAACVLTLGGSPARADIIQAVFTGTISAKWDWHVDFPDNPLGGLPFSYTFIFDTTKATATYRYDGFTEIYGALIGGSELWFSSIAFGGSYFRWSDDLLHGSASATIGEQNVGVGFGSSDFFQNGTCGTRCGNLNTTSTVITVLSTSPVPVPGPLAGSGLPGLLAMLGLALARRRYVKVMVNVRPKS
jgi:hypothetical protein